MLVTELQDILYNRMDCAEILTYHKMDTVEVLKILNLRDNNNELPYRVCRLNKANLIEIKEALLNGYYDPSDNTTDAEILESIESIHTVKQLKNFLKQNKTEWYRTYLGYYVEWL